MPISDALLKILVCPDDKSSLRMADADFIERLNRNISAGQVKNRAGNVVTERVSGALIRADNRYAYPIRHDIPIMLVDEGIEVPRRDQSV
ncbi:MAG: hypothetical protein DCC75_02135 [Proteobacteria bacterium]|nr:MAG: hypothetical protein DCC75_02135 [Pseudomonadota bacterium]